MNEAKPVEKKQEERKNDRSKADITLLLAQMIELVSKKVLK